MPNATSIEWRNDPDAARETFITDGYIVLRGFLSADEVAETSENLTRFIADVLPMLPREQVFYEDLSQPDSLKQIQQMFREPLSKTGLSEFQAAARLQGPESGPESAVAA